MSTVVFENRASSCFESILSEATTVKLKVAAAAQATGGGAGFPQSFHKETGDCYTERDNYKGCPWAKKSSFSTLSAESLELCTENIGSESGSDVITGAAADAIFNYKRAESDGYSRRRLSSQKKTHHSFPPPLTTMRSLTLQARRHTEGGRLIIEAVEAPFGNSYLLAERSDGRLRMSFLTAETTTSAAAGEEEAENEVELDQSKEEIVFDEETNDNLEMEKYQWLSRCGNKGLCSNWKPAFWVATS